MDSTNQAQDRSGAIEQRIARMIDVAKSAGNRTTNPFIPKETPAEEFDHAVNGAGAVGEWLVEELAGLRLDLSYESRVEEILAVQRARAESRASEEALRSQVRMNLFLIRPEGVAPIDEGTVGVVVSMLRRSAMAELVALNRQEKDEQELEHRSVTLHRPDRASRPVARSEEQASAVERVRREDANETGPKEVATVERVLNSEEPAAARRVEAHPTSNIRGAASAGSELPDVMVRAEIVRRYAERKGNLRSLVASPWKTADGRLLRFKRVTIEAVLRDAGILPTLQEPPAPAVEPPPAQVVPVAAPVRTTDGPKLLSLQACRTIERRRARGDSFAVIAEEESFGLHGGGTGDFGAVGLEAIFRRSMAFHG